MAVARAKGKLKGKRPKLTARQQAHPAKKHATGEHTVADLAEIFSVSRATVYWVLERSARSTPAAPALTGQLEYAPSKGRRGSGQAGRAAVQVPGVVGKRGHHATGVACGDPAADEYLGLAVFFDLGRVFLSPFRI